MSRSEHRRLQRLLDQLPEDIRGEVRRSALAFGDEVVSTLRGRVTGRGMLQRLRKEVETKGAAWLLPQMQRAIASAGTRRLPGGGQRMSHVGVSITALTTAAIESASEIAVALETVSVVALPAVAPTAGVIVAAATVGQLVEFYFVVATAGAELRRLGIADDPTALSRVLATTYLGGGSGIEVASRKVLERVAARLAAKAGSSLLLGINLLWEPYSANRDLVRVRRAVRDFARKRAG